MADETLINDVVIFFKMMSNESRVRILWYLVNQSRPVNVGAIVAATGLSQPTASKHLAVLTQQGLVTRAEAGNRVFYAVEDQHLKETMFSTVAHMQHAATGHQQKRA
jgi:DNA-binding transcriptional ArsR family regulator